MQKITYLDHNATTKLSPEALAKMNEVYPLPLNNSSTHQLGRLGYQLVEEAREEVQKFLNGQNYQVIFTGSSTEATNQVFFSSGVKTILFCPFEHSSVYNSRPKDAEIIELAALENGLLDLEDLKAKLDKISDKNFLVSLMLANNETGAIQPVKETAKIVHQKGGLFHCDIVQAAGKIPVDLEELNPDFVSISAHKIRGPQGVGALLVRKGIDIEPLIHGGKQEKGKRAGTSNTAGIAGFGTACKLAATRLALYKTQVAALRDHLESELKKIAGNKVKFFCDNVARLPNTSYVALRDVDAQTQLIFFDLNKICVSAGAACSSGTTAAPRVLKTMNVSPEFSNSAIRVSLCLETTEQEINHFIATWKKLYERTVQK